MMSEEEYSQHAAGMSLLLLRRRGSTARRGVAVSGCLLRRALSVASESARVGPTLTIARPFPLSATACGPPERRRRGFLLHHKAMPQRHDETAAARARRLFPTERARSTRLCDSECAVDHQAAPDHEKPVSLCRGEAADGSTTRHQGRAESGGGGAGVRPRKRAAPFAADIVASVLCLGRLSPAAREKRGDNTARAPQPAPLMFSTTAKGGVISTCRAGGRAGPRAEEDDVRLEDAPALPARMEGEPLIGVNVRACVGRR